MDKIEKSVELHKLGYNCGQSVFCAFIDKFNLDNDTALKMSQALGSGLGGLREICGAVNAMALIIGLLDGTANPKDKETKKKLYDKVTELANKFRDKNGYLTCKELLGLDKKDSNFKPKKTCEELIRESVKLLVDNYPELNS